MAHVRGPRRSALYLPASNRRAIQKAARLECDVVILDLEDSVAPDAKDIAREQAIEALRSAVFAHAEVALRVNALATPWGAKDLDALRGVPLGAVLVPKVSSAADVQRYDRIFDKQPFGSTQLWAMIETARSLFRLEEIAAVAQQSRLSTLVLGTNDLAKEMRAALDVSRTPLLGALGMTVAAARAFGLDILDGVYNDFGDVAGFAIQCRQAAAFGFDGKTLIHPNQIAVCNAAFSPQPEDLRWAESIIKAFDLPENREVGVIRLDGKMVERLHLDQARRVVELQAAISAKPRPE